MIVHFFRVDDHCVGGVQCARVGCGNWKAAKIPAEKVEGTVEALSSAPVPWGLLGLSSTEREGLEELLEELEEVAAGEDVWALEVEGFYYCQACAAEHHQEVGGGDLLRRFYQEQHDQEGGL